MNNKKIGSIAVMSTVAASMLLTGCGEAKKIEKFFAEGEYSDALDFYESKKISDKEKKTIAANMKAHAEEVLEQFAKDEVNYKTASKVINTIIKMELDSISEEALEASVKLDKLNKSKTAFEEAKEAEKNNILLEAIELYKQVIEEDINFETAKSKTTTLRTAYIKDAEKRANSYLSDDNAFAAIRVYSDEYNITGWTEFKEKHDKLYKESEEKVYQSVDNFVENKNFYDAVNLLDSMEWVSIWSEESRANFRTKRYEVNEAANYYNYEKSRDSYLESVEYYFVNGNYYWGFDYLNGPKNQYPEYAEKDQVYKDACLAYEERYYNAAIAASQRFMDEKVYDRAIATIESYINTHSNEMLVALRDKLVAERPVYLADLEVNNSYRVNWYDNRDVITSSLGKEYIVCKNCLSIQERVGGDYDSDYDGYVEYVTDGKYTKLTGILDTIDGSVIYAPEVEEPETPDTPENPEDVENPEEPAEQPEVQTYPYSEESGVFEIYGNYWVLDEEGEAPEEGEVPEGTDQDAHTPSGHLESKLLYTLDVTGATEPVKIDVDITDAASVTIKFNHNTGDMSVLLYDWTVE